MSRGWRDTTHRRDARVCGERGGPTGSGQHQHGLPAQPPGHAVFDAAGNTYYLAGAPTPGAAQNIQPPAGGVCLGFAGLHGPSPVPCPYAMVSKFDPSGAEVWGAELGGPAASNLTGASSTALAVAANGNVAFTGSTGGQFPTTPGAAIGSSTSATAFAAMVSADGSKFLYSTYLPDSVGASSSIAVDAAGNAYIAGKTSSGHAFVLKLSADGSTIVYNATLAGSGADACHSHHCRSSGQCLRRGANHFARFSSNRGRVSAASEWNQNSFLATLAPSGNVLTSTYFGGSGCDKPSSTAVDSAGDIDLAGSTSSLDLPTTPGSMQPSSDRASVEQLLTGRLRGAVRPGRHFVEVGELCDEQRSPKWSVLGHWCQCTWGGPEWRYLHGRADRPRISGDIFGSSDLLPGFDQPHQRLPGSPELERCAPGCNLSGDQHRRRCRHRWGSVAASRRCGADSPGASSPGSSSGAEAGRRRPAFQTTCSTPPR